MQTTFLVMAGGALGAALRYHVGVAVAALAGERWPWGTLAVNLAGALLMGLVAGAVLTRGIDEGWRLFLAVGLLGGFTTFSAFGLEMWQMVARGAWLGAAGYALLSVTATLALTAAGIAAMRALLAA